MKIDKNFFIDNFKNIFFALIIAILIRSFIEAYRHMPLYNPVNLYTTAPIIVINIVPFIIKEFGIELNSDPNLRKIDKLKHIAVNKISCKYTRLVLFLKKEIM